MTLGPELGLSETNSVSERHPSVKTLPMRDGLASGAAELYVADAPRRLHLTHVRRIKRHEKRYHLIKSNSGKCSRVPG